MQKDEDLHSETIPVIEREYPTPPVSQTRITVPVTLNTTPNLPMFSGQDTVPSMQGSIDQWLFHVEGALATHMEEAVRSAVLGSVRGTAHELLEFIGYGEEMDVILIHIKEHFGKGPSKAKVQKKFSLIKQRKSESINQFTGRVEQCFKQLGALYPGSYDCSQLKEWTFHGMYPHLRDSMQFLYMKEDVGYEDFLVAVYEAKTKGSEGKIVRTKAKALTVEKVSENSNHIVLKDLK